jgi:hypothetical protein
MTTVMSGCGKEPVPSIRVTLVIASAEGPGLEHDQSQTLAPMKNSDVAADRFVDLTNLTAQAGCIF